ncbi:unnamed protein product [Diamesa hyperborea]
MQFEVKVIEDSLVFSDPKVPSCKSYEFPLIWLRDNCLCEMCYDPATYTRTIDWDNFDCDVSSKRTYFNGKSNKLEITWQDDHESSFPYEWLMERNFSLENREEYLKNFYQPERKLWSKEGFVKILKTFEFKDVIDNDEVLLKWLEALSVNGVAILKNTPSTEQEVKRLGERVRFVKKTHYGDDFVVQAKSDSSTFAYTTAALPFHTDVPYYEYMPCINILHCLVQSESHGGRNTIVDAFYVASLMKKQYPELYNILTTVKVNWSDIGDEGGREYYFVYRAPVFCLNLEGEIVKIKHSVTQRDSVFTNSVQEVTLWYKAIETFVKLMKEEAVQFKMISSDTLTFDNIRLCHGRTAYVDTGNNSRTLIGATYTRTIDWDNFKCDFNAKLNKLEITWQDNHESSFPYEWLMERNFSLENREEYLKNFYRPEKKMWNKDEFSKILKTFEFKDVIDNDKVLMKWLEALATNGIAILKNTPSHEDEVKRLAERVRFVKKTHYGDAFIVQAKPTTSTFAYTTSALQLHVDIPYYEYMPCINLLHCLVQSDSHGGRNTVLDGFYVANMMKQQYPEFFKILTTVKVNWCDIGDDGGREYYFLYRAPVIMYYFVID